MSTGFTHLRTAFRTALVAVGFSGLLLVQFLGTASAEDESANLAVPPAAPTVPKIDAVSQSQLDANISQINAEIRSQRNLAELRLSTLENEVQQSADYVERLLLAFMIAGGVVVFVVLATLNKQGGINNEKMRNLIREAEHTLGDLHRMLDRPEAEHFHVSRKLTRIMNKIRQTEHPSLVQKEIGDIYAASEDPTLPVTLHLQANALRREQAGDYEQAIILWERLLSIEDNNPEILLQLAKNYKKLAEASSGPRVAGLRNTSLDYFQHYALRTNQHMTAARDLQRHMDSSINQMPVPLEQAWGVSEQRPPKPINPTPINNPQAGQSNTPQMAHQVKAQEANLSIQQPSGGIISNGNITKEAEKQNKTVKFKDSGVSKIKSVSKQKNAGQRAEAPVATASQPKTTETKTLQTEPEGDQSSSQDKAEKPAPANETTPPIEADSSSDAVNVKKTNNKEKKIVPQSAARTKKPGIGAQLQSANGKAAKNDRPSSENLGEEEKERAFNSRMSKAKEYFNRFKESSKKGDKMRWLMTAADELKNAERYKQTEMLYRLSGITWLEISGLGKGDQNAHVKTALHEFTKGEEKFEGSFCCEMALCHARLKNEDECKAAIEKAKSTGTLNIAIISDEPTFEVYKNRPWYQQLLSTS